jgi:hypothetical protein
MGLAQDLLAVGEGALEQAFATKPEPAWQMIERAVQAEVPFAWAAGDESAAETAPPLPPPAVRIPTRTWKEIERLTRSNVGRGPRRKAGCET